MSFVVSAGNYRTPPLLDFPRQKAQVSSGRITSPADSVLAKHDETYMPKEVADSLKEKGIWQDSGG